MSYPLAEIRISKRGADVWGKAKEFLHVLVLKAPGMGKMDQDKLQELRGGSSGEEPT